MAAWTKRIEALLAGAAWSTGHADSQKDHGAMVALDEVEWIPRLNSPVGAAAPAGDPATGAHVRQIELPAGFVAPDHAHTGDYHGATSG